jgi:hypothetical protein
MSFPLGQLSKAQLSEPLHHVLSDLIFPFNLSCQMRKKKKYICLHQSDTPNHGILFLMSQQHNPEMSRKLVSLLLTPTLLETYESLQICLSRFRNVFYNWPTK